MGMPASRSISQAARAAAFGQRIRQLRRAKRATQKQIAELVPMSPANLSRLENGDQGPPSDEIIDALARALDADLSELRLLAGRGVDREAFEEQVLHQLSAIRVEMNDGFDLVLKAIAGRI
jgi:transcriptional regulator with XRE-family HTH domain